MSALSELNEAVSKLSREERFQLFERLRGEFEPWTTEAFQQAIQAGIDDLDQGRFTTYDKAGLAESFAGVKRRGRERLAESKSALS